MGYTAGPWIAESTDVFAGSIQIAEFISLHHSLSEAEADARLAASAPCLVAALEQIGEAIVSWEKTGWAYLYGMEARKIGKIAMAER